MKFLNIVSAIELRSTAAEEWTRERIEGVSGEQNQPRGNQKLSRLGLLGSGKHEHSRESFVDYGTKTVNSLVAKDFKKLKKFHVAGSAMSPT